MVAQRDIEGIYPLSPVQNGMLLASLAAPEGAFIEQVEYEIEGPLDAIALEAAWGQLVQRHSMLRTGFVWSKGDRPVQFVLRDSSQPMQIVDLTTQPQSERDAQYERMKAQCRQPFVLSRVPLSRLTLVRLDASRSRLIWTVHHLLADGWCNPILIGELLECYQAIREGRRWRSATAPRPYREYVAWLQKQDAQAAASFWKAELATAGEPAPLGVADEACAGGTGYVQFRLGVDPRITATIAQRLRASRLTMGMLVHGLWMLALAHAGQARRVVIGTTVSGRPSQLSGIDSTMGLFINTLPLVGDIDPQATLVEWLARLQQRHVGIREFEHCTAGQIHAWSGADHGRALFESIVVWENYPRLGSSTIGEIRDVRLVSGSGGKTAYPLTLIASEHPDLTLQLIGDASVLPEESIARFAGTLERLFAAAAVALEHGQTVASLLESIAAMPRPRYRPRGGSLEGDTGARDCEGELELAVAQVWRERLGVRELDPTQSFFRLGGHSLLAMHLLAAMREKFGVSLSLVDLFEHATVRSMADLLRTRGAAPRIDAPPESPPESLTHDAAARFEPFPLTDIQQAYWVGRRGGLQEHATATHSYIEIDVHESLDAERARRALRRLILRHDMLRAVFLEDGTQRVLPEVPDYRIALHDCRGQDRESRLAHLHAVRARLSHQVLPSDRWPLFALEATRLADAHYRLHISVDMLIVDGSSYQALAHDLVTLYRGDEDLPAIAITFRDYVLAMERQRALPAFTVAREYWHARLDTMPGPPELPLRGDPFALLEPRFRRRSITLDAVQWQRVRAAAKQLGVSDSGLLLGLYAQVLSYWSRSDSFTLTLTHSARQSLHPQVHCLVGDFTTTLPAQVPASTGTLGERIRALQQQLWNDMDHAQYSGVQVLRELNRRRGGGLLLPFVFTSALVYDREASDAGDAGELTDFMVGQGGEQSEEAFSIGQTSQVWLDLQAIGHRGGLLLLIDALDEVFPPGMVDDLTAALESLLHAVCDSPKVLERTRVDLLPEAQRAVRARVNATRQTLPLAPLHELALSSAHAGPAVLCHDRAIDFPALRRAVARLHTRMRDRGLRPGSRVGIVSLKGWEQVVASLAILRAGCAYVPIDADQPAARCRELILQVNAAMALCQPGEKPAECLPPALPRVIVDEELLRESGDGADDAEAENVSLDDLAYVIFTSGSTGRPKGVAIDHRGAVNTVLDVNQRFGVTADDRVLGLSSFNFDLSVYDTFGVPGAGGALVLPDARTALHPAHWFELIARHGVTLLNAVPALIQTLVDYLEENRLMLPASVRLIMMSGDWIPVTLPDRIRARSAGVPRIVSLGGATEVSIWSVAFPIEAVDPAWSSIPYGAPLLNQTCQVVHRNFAPCPDFVPGELCIGGIGVAREYYGDADRTAASFVTDPVSGERLYRTGDLARFLPDGMLEILGREDGQVKVQGHRIELAEIETHLLRHPHVKAAAVSTTGKGNHRSLYACVVLEADAAAVAEEQRRAQLEGHLAERLPRYMVPGAFLFVERLPLGPNGKLDRKNLPVPALAAVNTDGKLLDAKDRLLADLWEELLGLRPSGPQDNFISLGGNSMALIQLHTRLQSRLGISVGLRQLFQLPTFQFMRSLMEDAPGSLRIDAPALHGESPAAILSYEQERIWFALREDALTQGYNICNAVGIGMQVDVALIQKAFDELLRVHEELRARFSTRDGAPLKRIAGLEECGFALAVTEVPADVRDSTAARLLAEERAHVFDLENENPLRVRLVTDAARSAGVLIINVHHIVVDAWSMGVLSADLLRILRAVASGEAQGAQGPAARYVQYAQWQREWLSGAESARQREYWRARLAGLPPVTLADSLPRPVPRDRRAASVAVDIPASLSADLRSLHAAEVTPFTLLTAAVATALYLRGAGDDFGIGASVTTRRDARFDGVVGLFLNQVVMRVDLRANPTAGELFRQLRDTIESALANSELPFGEVVATVAQPRDASRSPLFDVIVNHRQLPDLGSLADSATTASGDPPVARFDLSFDFDEGRSGLQARIVYAADLFTEEAARQLAVALGYALAELPRDPGREISRLREQSMTAKGNTMERFKRGVRKPIDLANLRAVEEGLLGGRLPYVYEAATPNVDTFVWLEANRAAVDQALIQHGAVLLRGFSLAEIPRFEALLQRMCREVIADYGDLPEEKGTRNVYGSTPYPADRAILFHNESSHLQSWPARQFFACVLASATGGETPLVDCRRVFDRLDATVRERFVRLGLRYTRNFIEGLDVSWQQFFKTQDRADVARACAAAATDYRWQTDGTLTLQRLAPAALRHPVAGTWSFFNQIMLHHPYFLRPEERDALVTLYGEGRLPRHVTFGDGSALDDALLAEISALYDAEAVRFPWRAGDVVMLDNLSVAHGRSPFTGPRKIIVGMGDPMEMEAATPLWRVAKS